MSDSLFDEPQEDGASAGDPGPAAGQGCDTCTAAPGHVLIHAQVDGATEAELRELAEALKAAALERGAAYAYAIVQPPRAR